MKTFQPNKTITELGIDTTRKFVVVRGKAKFNIGPKFIIGDILTLVEDNDTPSPYFQNQDGRENYFYLDNLAYREINIIKK